MKDKKSRVVLGKGFPEIKIRMERFQKRGLKVGLSLVVGLLR